MATILVTGGTGLIGSALTNALVARGDEVIILSRNGQQPKQNSISFARWDPSAHKLDESAIAKADHVVHLAGANVAEKRWSMSRKKEILDSRVESGKVLAHAIKTIPNKVRSVVSASAIGYYGPDPVNPNPRPFIETDPAAPDFLGTIGGEWEEAIGPVKDAGKRLVILRTGIVLSDEGGAYPEFKKTLRFGIASIIGNGRQVVSWIHMNDLVNIYMEAIYNENWKGAYNAVAPSPASNGELVLSIARERRKFFILVHVPSIVLKAVLGEMSVEVLKSTTVSAAKVMATGYEFKFPTIPDAVKNLEPHQEAL
jgi:uncharacterized protein (TIGR01777 family)